MNLSLDRPLVVSRREMLRASAAGFGWLAFAALQAAEAEKYRNPLAPKEPHFRPRAKRVIFLFMSGGPSHLETFDWKPSLLQAAASGADPRLLSPLLDFKPSGASGLFISQAFPALAKHADDLCILNGMKTSNPDHQQAVVALHTGSERFVRPSLGAWVTYGLGSDSQELPGFVTIDPTPDLGGAMNYGSAFLPAAYQGTRLEAGERALPNLHRRMEVEDQRRQIDFTQQLNRRALARRRSGSPEIEGAIQALELAWETQDSVPRVLETGSEPTAVRELYGLDDPSTSRFGLQCLMARRLAEKGVRFIQLTNKGWDHHQDLRAGILTRAAAIDRPIAALITDLKQRGLLDDTLIVWGGEFGRGAYEDGGDHSGRGHNNKGYSMWMAGGGVRGGLRYGATDELGARAVEGVVDTNDLHATILYLLGIDHELLTYRYAGREFRLTNVAGKVAKAIVA
jgi:hypothetical protein